MLDLGFVSAILAGNSFEEVIDFAASHEFKCVEIMCWPQGKAERRYAGVTHINVQELDDKSITHIQSRLSWNGIYISALGYYPNPLDPDKEKAAVYVEHIKKVIKAAARLEIGVVNTFIGRDPARSLDYNLGRFRETWPEIIKVAEEQNIKIGIENCPMLFTKDEWPGGKNLAISPAIWDQMFEAIPSNYFGLNYDPSHLVWMQMDEVQPIYDYAEKLHHIHLKDVKVYRDKLNRVGILAYPLEYHSPKIPGLGDVRWRDFFSALTSVGYRGPVCIEVEDRAYEGSAEDIQAAILTSRNYLRQFVPG
ncbi:MAG: sugar phosphate isomerase/epimerase [Phaeodactylibacter sp.]|nr:sugar phosphate isomerase/epimerase [Phaeodactylibacter sp.]MCB9265897.1 sugar phosphate isomerase/epimerase [Lewinellaceae bacterium]MCB9288687.1 sugar phosphate isomerase/epimerase [Lewinellaceae bacterium]